jgi:quinoprotein glucose dehydrogenase
MKIHVLIFAASIFAASVSVPLVLAQGPADWPTYNRDPANTRYSPLTQINTKNVGKLTQAWSYALKSEATGRGAPRASGSEATPIVVDGVMYLPAAGRVVALQPETGKEIWRYQLPAGSPNNRGVTYWPGDQNNPPRIIFTSGHFMVGLNAKTGKMDPGFGKEGQVDLVVPYNSPPTVYKNFLFVGANVPEINAPNLPGDTRAYDARTGVKLWEFHSVPRAGEPGAETWELPDSWKDRTGANNWSFQMTVDAPRDTLYTIFGSPASDFYGGDRKGNDLYGNSIVALDVNTGKMKWFFQVVHHDVWDFDLSAPPALLDVTVKGKKTPVLALTGKVGYMYILNRVTGEPVFGVKETPVPKSQVPGEFLSPTQEIPVKPPPFGRMSFTMADLVTAADTTEEHAAACRDLVEKSGGAHNEGPFTPYAYRAPGAPPVSNVLFPGPIGGVNWGGSAADPKLGYVYVFTNEYGSIGWVQKEPDTSKIPYQQASILGNPFNSKFWAVKKDENGLTLGAQSWPCQRPPWGRLTAVNVATGEFAWQIRLGVTDELPEAKRNTGRIGFGGPITTAGGLLFIGATNDKRFRAFDSKTGKQLWETKLDYNAIAVPITYQGKDGKQYVAITAANGGAGVTDPDRRGGESLVVFALP